MTVSLFARLHAGNGRLRSKTLLLVEATDVAVVEKEAVEKEECRDRDLIIATSAGEAEWRDSSMEEPSEMLEAIEAMDGICDIEGASNSGVSMTDSRTTGAAALGMLISVIRTVGI